MAAESESKVCSSFLFTHEDGSPMVFVIPPGVTKKKLRPIVESGGGVITSIETPGSIRLVEPGFEDVVEKMVSCDFVFDSYQHGALCNMEDYRRMRYSIQEDKAILDYINKFEGQDIKLSGNKIWQEMEEKKVICHPWQSVRSHFLSSLRHNTKSSQKGKLEFVESKILNSRNQFPKSAKAKVSTNKKNVFNCNVANKGSEYTESHSYCVQKDIKMNEKGDKLQLGPLPKDLQSISFENNYLIENCDETVLQTDHKSPLKKGYVVKSLRESKFTSQKAKDIPFKDLDPQAGQTPFSVSSKRCHPDDMSKRNCAQECSTEAASSSQFNFNRTADGIGQILKCEQLFQNYKQLQKMSLETKMPNKILHALYVSSGYLEDALHVLKTGFLLNGQESWKKEEDMIISSGDNTAINELIHIRGREAVNLREQFINSF